MSTVNGEKILFTPTVYNRKESNEILDRSFKQFGQQVTGSKALSLTIEQFFMDYEDLFYSIPITGITGSHQYLAERSGQLVKIDAGETLTDVEPLLSEITSLREQSVEDQQTILNLQQQVADLQQLISQSSGE